LPVVAGSTQGRLALPPGNNLQQGTVSGEVRLPIFAATTLTYNASIGRLGQDAGFLPLSTLPGGATLPASSLDGDVRLSHYALALSSRPLNRLYVRGTASYDGRDDRTRPLAIAYIVTDTLPGGVPFTRRFGQDRIRLDGSADYRLFRWLRLGAGGEYLNVVYAPGQEISYTAENRSWARATLNPLSSVTIVLKGGDAHRGASNFDVTVLPVNENPLLRAYEYAARDQNFFTATASWALTSALTWSLEGSWTDEAYRSSPLGLQDGRDRSLATTLAWAPSARSSFYVDGSYQRLSARQNGSIGSGAPIWRAQDAQHFWTLAAGGRWALSSRWDLGVDYLRAQSNGETNMFSGGVAEPFPLDKTRLDSVRINTSYQWTPALRMRLHYGHEKYDTSDWALDNVGPDTVTNLLALGAQPYRHNVNVVGLTARYQFGTVASAKAAD
ncbi:MAG TPA: MtrB/PioB family outer membrane beta-barrel protein, partial [Steroidobacteraceae bacterium]